MDPVALGTPKDEMDPVALERRWSRVNKPAFSCQLPAAVIQDAEAPLSLPPVGGFTLWGARRALIRDPLCPRRKRTSRAVTTTVVGPKCCRQGGDHSCCDCSI
ncbi:unnamed protein product [Gadus morhua 'NCC']